MICPHCSERTTVDVETAVTETSEVVGSLEREFNQSVTRDSCQEDFSCKTEW